MKINFANFYFCEQKKFFRVFVCKKTKGGKMIVNNINFGKTMKVVGNNNVKSAYRIADLINGHAPKTRHEAQVQNQLWEIFPDATVCYPAQALNLNNGKDVFIVTGEESKKIRELDKDKINYINCAYQNYGKNQEMIDNVIESENDRYERLAGDFAYLTSVGNIAPIYSTKAEAVKSININA